MICHEWRRVPFTSIQCSFGQNSAQLVALSKSCPVAVVRSRAIRVSGPSVKVFGFTCCAKVLSA
jgi:hypothetical protein